MNEHWIRRFCALYPFLGARSKLCDLPAGTIVESLDEYNGDFMRVLYRTAAQTFTGWICRQYAEELSYALPHNVVNLGDLATPNPQDAAQYVIYLNQVQYNLCGELCVCSIFGVHLPAFLEQWKAKPLTHFQQVFQGGKSRTTGVGDLIDMAKIYPCEVTTIREAFADPHAPGILISPRRVASFLERGWQMIMGVHIEGLQGELRPSGIPHWVTLRALEPTGIGRGLAQIYNPFSNNVEEYSWGELMRSAGNVFGVLLRAASPG